MTTLRQHRDNMVRLFFRGINQSILKQEFNIIVECYIGTQHRLISKSLLHMSKMYYLFPDFFDLLLSTRIRGSSFTALISVVSSVVCSFSLQYSSSLFLFAFDVSRFQLLPFSFVQSFLFVSFPSLLGPESFLKHFVVSLLYSEYLYCVSLFWNVTGLFFCCMIPICLITLMFSTKYFEIFSVLKS